MLKRSLQAHRSNQMRSIVPSKVEGSPRYARDDPRSRIRLRRRFTPRNDFCISKIIVDYTWDTALAFARAHIGMPVVFGFFKSPDDHKRDGQVKNTGGNKGFKRHKISGIDNSCRTEQIDDGDQPRQRAAVQHEYDFVAIGGQGPSEGAG